MQGYLVQLGNDHLDVTDTIVGPVREFNSSASLGAGQWTWSGVSAADGQTYANQTETGTYHLSVNGDVYFVPDTTYVSELTSGAVSSSSYYDQTEYGTSGADTDIDGGAENDIMYGGVNSSDTANGSDTMHGGAGYDTINSGDGADTIIGSGGNDTIHAGSGADVIYGDNETTLTSTSESLAWDAETTGTSVIGGFTQDTGSMNVTVAIENTGALDSAFASAKDIFTNGNLVPANSSLEIFANGGSGAANAHVTFNAADGTGMTDEVTNVSFILTDVDAGDWIDIVTVNAYDYNGNVVVVTLTPLSPADTVSGQTVTGGQGNDEANESSGAVLVDIAGPVHTLEIIYENGGDGSQVLNVSDILFDTIVDPDGDDIINSGADDDLIYAGGGADQINAGTGNDTIHLGFNDGAVDVVILNDGDGEDIIDEFEVPVANGDGTYTGVDQLDVSGMTNPDGSPVDVSSVTVTSDPDGDAVLTFLNGQIINLSGVSPSEVSNPAQLAAIGIPNNGVVEGTSGSDSIGSSYVDADGDMIDNNDAVLANDTGNDDLVLGYGGDDTIYAGQGSDEIYGGDGNDVLDASGNANTFYGDAGNDRIFGGGGSDTAFGGTGNDTIYASTGADEFHGGDGDDTVLGGGTASNGHDTLFGDAGNDSLSGGNGNDTVYGGSGDDIIGYGGTGTDTIVGGETLETTGDTLDISTSTTPIILDYTNGDAGDNESGSVGTVGGGAFFSEIENVVLGTGGDTVYGSTAADSFDTGAGADTITAGAGDDQYNLGDQDGDVDVVVFADGDGNDTITGFDAPIDNGDGTFTGGDQLDVWNLNAADGFPVSVHDVDVTSDGNGGSILNFPNGETITLVGVDPALIDTPAALAAMGIFQPDGTISGTSGDDQINAAYTGDPDYDRIDNNDAVIPGSTGNDDLVEAGAGHDTVYAGEGNDEIYGGTGDDKLYAGNANDTLHGEAGNDSLYGGLGDDTIFGGTGNDVVFTGSGNDVVDLGDGNDTAYLLSGDETAYGGLGQDNFYIGLNAGDKIVEGGEGDDGLGDYLYMDNGTVDTTVIATGDEAGVATIGTGTTTFSEIERIAVDDGDDLVDLSASNLAMTVYGNAGNDTLIGTSGDDFILGEVGDDYVNGGVGNDTLYGGSGNDTLRGDDGDDSVSGGIGNDTIELQDGFGIDDVFGGNDAGGADVDTLDAFALTSDLTLTLNANDGEEGTLTDGTNTVTFDDIEEIKLGSGNDTVTGSNGNDTVDAGDGADTINLGAGDDSVALGNDGAVDVLILEDGFGNDTITSYDNIVSNGDGTYTSLDKIDVSNLYDLPAGDPNRSPVLTNDVTVTDDGSGSAVLNFPNGETLTLHGVSPTLADDPFFLNAIGIPLPDGTIEGTAGADYINASYDGDPDGDMVDGGDNVFLGNAANDDLIVAGAGNDTVHSGDGNDVVYAGDDNDSIRLGDGDDLGYGGQGRDFFFVAAGEGNDTIFGGEGGETSFGDLLDMDQGDVDTTVIFTGDEAGLATFAGGSVEFSEIERVYTSDGDDTIDMSASSTGMTIVTRDGNDSVIGGSGNDYIGANADNDTLDGGLGDDTIFGGGGQDTIVLSDNFGNDTLYGLTGSDTLDGSGLTGDVTVNLASASNGSITDGVDTAIFTEIENIVTGSGDDSITGSSGNDDITAGAGADTINLGAGNDTLDLGAGSADGENDVVILQDGFGDDIVSGFDAPTANGDGSFTGRDTLDVANLTDTNGDPINTHDVIVSDDNGNAVLSFPNGESITLVGISAVDADDAFFLNAMGIPLSDGIVEGTASNDAINGTYIGDPDGDMVDGDDNVVLGNAANDDIIYGYDGNDTITAGAGDDEVYGGTGNDTVYSGAGNDSIDLGDGNDFMYFGTGDDTVLGGQGSDAFFVNNQPGNSTIIGGEGGEAPLGDYIVFDGDLNNLSLVATGDEAGWASVGASTVTFSEIEAIFADEGEDYVDLSASSVGMSVYGYSGADVFIGSSGDDILNLGIGADTVTGGAGDDIIRLGSSGSPDGDDDVVMLTDGMGADTIHEFDAPVDNGDGTFSGIDRFDATQLAAADGFPVTAHDVVVTADTNGDAVLTFPNGESVTLVGVPAANVDSLFALEAMGFGIPDGTVSGTSGDDLIDATYVGDPDLDMIDADDAIYGIGNDDIVEAGAGNDTVFAGVGNDSIRGEDGDDTIYGGAGEDTIDGGDGVNVIYAGADNDLISGGSPTEDSTIYGGTGNDQIEAQGGMGSQTIYGDEGDDFIVDNGFDTSHDVIFGGIGNDDVLGGRGNDAITGGAGDDIAVGGEGDDTFYLADDYGTDILEGGSGDETTGDVLDATAVTQDSTLVFGSSEELGPPPDDGGPPPDDGGPPPGDLPPPDGGEGPPPGDDPIAGGGTFLTTGLNEADTGGFEQYYLGSGNDTVTGDENANWVDMGEGADTFIVADSFGADTVIGGEGATNDLDTIDGTALTSDVTVTFTSDEAGTMSDGIDTLTFSEIEDITLGEGNDTVIGGTGNDTVEMGEGADTFMLSDNFGTDTVAGGEFGSSTEDHIDGSALTDGVLVNFSGDEAGSIQFGTDTVTFTEIEKVTTGSGNDTLYGSDGADELVGGAGNDQLSGGADDDELIAGDGNDYVEGGAGNDTLDGGAGEDVLSYFGSADGVTVDLTSAGPQIGGDAEGDLVSNFEQIDGSVTGADTLTADTSGTRVKGWGGDDTLFGNIGEDNIDGGAGNDSIYGGDSNDSILGGDGDDYIDAGDGDDIIDGGDGGDTIDAGTGEDIIYAGDGDDIIDGGAGNDTIYFGEGNDTVLAGAGDDYIDDAGNVQLTGANSVDGGTGNDTIYTGDGDDTLVGGLGEDALYGELGNDTFIVAEGDLAEGYAGDDTFTITDLGETSTGAINIDGGNWDETTGDSLAFNGLLQVGTLNATNDGTGSYSGTATLTDGTVVTFNEIENIICFTPGTLIATPKGARDIATLKKGDMVVTRDHGLQPIRWIQSRTVPATGTFAPIRIRPGVVTGQDRDLLVSPQHRMLFQGHRAELLFGESEVLVSAKHLVDGKDVTQDEGEDVTYIHMMFDEHEIVFAEGAATESFHPGSVGLSAVSEPARDELFDLFPELRTNANGYGQTARRCLKKHETSLLTQ